MECCESAVVACDGVGGWVCQEEGVDAFKDETRAERREDALKVGPTRAVR